MPLDVLGRTRVTLVRPTGLSYPEGVVGGSNPEDLCGNPMKAYRDGDRALQLSLSNEEFLVDASHQLASITSLPFVHTASRIVAMSFCEPRS